MSIDVYFKSLTSIINESTVVVTASVTYDKRTVDIGFVRGEIWFQDQSVLHFREFVKTGDVIERYMYVYHYQGPSGDLHFRYDNTPHFPNIATFPHHKHSGSESDVIAADPPTLETILEEIVLQYMV